MSHTASLAPDTLFSRYREQVRDGLIERDAAQEAVVARLDKLREALADYQLAQQVAASRLAVPLRRVRPGRRAASTSTDRSGAARRC